MSRKYNSKKAWKHPRDSSKSSNICPDTSDACPATRRAHPVRAASLLAPSLPELRPARVLRLFVTVEAVPFRSLVHPIPLQRLRTYICTQAAPSEPRNRPRLGKPGITTSCALNLTSLPRACTFSDQLRGPGLTLGPLHTPQSLPPVGAPVRERLRSVRTSGIFGRYPTHLRFLKKFPLSYDSK